MGITADHFADDHGKERQVQILVWISACLFRLLNKSETMPGVNLGHTSSHIKMAGESQFKGIGGLFNGNTMAGRANVAKATYAVVGLIIAYNMLKPKKA